MANQLLNPAAGDFIRWLHRAFYRDAPPEMVRITGERDFVMEPGEWWSRPEHDVSVGRHLPPSSARVDDFMRHFESRCRRDDMGKAARILAIATAHHRLNFIHPFPRRQRPRPPAHEPCQGLAGRHRRHGLWSISRGLARGLESRSEYKRMMDHADTPRQDDLDGRGHLSRRCLHDFVLWFLRVCLDQISFMASLFELNTRTARLKLLVARTESLKPDAARLLEEALIRGEFGRGDASRITGLPERSARRLLSKLIELGWLASDTPKGRISLRFPSSTVGILFTRLFPEDLE